MIERICLATRGFLILDNMNNVYLLTDLELDDDEPYNLVCVAGKDKGKKMTCTYDFLRETFQDIGQVNNSGVWAFTNKNA